MVGPNLITGSGSLQGKRVMQTQTVTTVKSTPMVAFLPNFDLSRVTARVAREHPDWSAERLKEAEGDYRLFLFECRTAKELTPSPDVDELWHAHILHTKDYVRDCQAYFGRYLHHEPQAAKCDIGDCVNACYKAGNDRTTPCTSCLSKT